MINALNSNGNEDTLRFYLDDITAHYQNNHQNCHATSGCQYFSLYG